MRKETNLQKLKAMVNASAFEEVKCRQYGVRVYNIEAGKEYNVIFSIEKINHRFYFVDHDGVKFPVSRTPGAERIAQEIIERKEWEVDYLSERADDLFRVGRTSVLGGLIYDFHALTDKLNIGCRHGDITYHDNGDCFCRFSRIS